MATQIKNAAMPGVPETDSDSWIVMQYDYLNSSQLIRPERDPLLGEYPEKSGIIRNDEANIYISGKWDAGYGNPIWAKIPMVVNGYEFIMAKREIFKPDWNQASWLHNSGVTASTISSTTLNEYGLPASMLWGSTTERLDAYALSYLQNQYLSSTAAQASYEMLDDLIKRHVWPTASLNTRSYSAAVIYTYDTVRYDSDLNGSITRTYSHRYEVSFSFGTAYLTVVVGRSQVGSNTPLYNFAVWYEDTPFLSALNSSVNSIYGCTPRQFWSNRGLSTQYGDPFQMVIDATDILGGPCAWGASRGSDYKSPGYEFRTLAVTPGIPHMFDTGDTQWIPIRQKHKKSGTSGILYPLNPIHSSAFMPEYYTEIEYINAVTHELHSVTIRRRDDYVMYSLDLSSSKATKIWQAQQLGFLGESLLINVN